MKKSLVSILLLLIFFNSHAQKNIVINGKIVIKKMTSIESTTVYLIHPKDSSVIAYIISDKNGFFKLETKPIKENVIFKVSAAGYQKLSVKMKKITKNVDFGLIKLLEYKNKLDEVAIIMKSL